MVSLCDVHFPILKTETRTPKLRVSHCVKLIAVNLGRINNLKLEKAGLSDALILNLEEKKVEALATDVSPK